VRDKDLEQHRVLEGTLVTSVGVVGASATAGALGNAWGSGYLKKPESSSFSGFDDELAPFLPCKNNGTLLDMLVFVA
jgi:hypothetical protein